MTRRGSVLVLAAAALGASLVPAAAGAQPPSDPPATAPSRLEISQISSGAVVAPEVRLTEVNGRQATLAGGYVGWLTDKRLLVGAAGYWLANRRDDFQMQYGGALARWTFLADRPVAVSAGLFAGFGTATLSRPFGDVFGPPRTAAAPATGRVNGSRVRFGGPSITADTPVRVHDDYLLAEPQAGVVWSVTPWLRLDLSAAYRLVGASDLLGRQLRGPSGSLALQFGAR